MEDHSNNHKESEVDPKVEPEKKDDSLAGVRPLHPETLLDETAHN